MIRILELSKRFRKLQALDSINATFEPGQVVALIGPNGSGKTTLIKVLLGLVRADRGTIEVNGKLVTHDPAYRSEIGYMPQASRYPDNLKIGQVIQMVKDLRPDFKEMPDDDLLKAFHLPTLLEKPVRTLSGGTRQKLGASLAFYFNPPVLVLDEPTAGLDPVAAELLKAKVQKAKRAGKLILITSHILSDLDELVTHVLYLQEGRLRFFQPIEELQRQTGEQRVSRIVAHLMLQSLKDSSDIPGPSSPDISSSTRPRS